MDRELVRTCSSHEAAILAAAAGKVVRVGSNPVRIYPPIGRLPIDPRSMTRYVARVEILDDPPDARSAGLDAIDVVRQLFGLYLGLPEDRRSIGPSRRQPTAA